MFSVVAQNHNEQMNQLVMGQFNLFQNKEGKLPSFSICMHRLNAHIPAALTVQVHLGDYTFYQPTPAGFWFSFRDSYLKLASDFESADVYVSGNPQSDDAFSASYLLMQAYMYRLLKADGFMIHSAAAVFRGQAILFCGQSGAGKSTQANLWKRYLHCDILNYDKPCVLCEKGGVYAHGSPWSGKERMIKNEFAPLRAIVFVEQAKKNQVERLAPAQAFAQLYLHNYVYPLTPETDTLYQSVLQMVADRVPVYSLSCDISEEAVEVLFDTLFPDTSYRREKEGLKMKYKVKDSFQMKRIADEYVVIPRGTQAIDFNAAVVFNESGAFLWELLADFTDADALVTALAKKYAIDETLARADVDVFLIKMTEQGLVDTAEGA